MRKRLLLGILLAYALLFILGQPGVSAQTGTTPTPRPVSADEVNRVSRNLYCPVCQNVPLEVCETDACARWREQVRDLLSQGYTEEKVRQYFIDHFGSKTVGTPTDPLSQFLTVVLPFAVIGLIGFGIAVSLVRWRFSRRVEVSAPPEVSRSVPPDDYRARLEAEVRKRD